MLELQLDETSFDFWDFFKMVLLLFVYLGSELYELFWN